MAWDMPPLRRSERHHIKVKDLPGKGRGVLAAKRLPANTVVMRAFPYVLRGACHASIQSIARSSCCLYALASVACLILVVHVLYRGIF